MTSWRTFAAVLILAGVASGATAAPAPAPKTTEQFVQRCKSDAQFCKTQILAAHALLERARKACLPSSVPKDAMAARVQDTILDVLEEDPDSFRTLPYRQIVDQLISYLWPCEPIS